MIMNTKNFGEISFEEKQSIRFPEGLLGFEDKREYLLLNNNDTEEPVPFMWLQSTEDPELALVVSIPFFLKPDYEVDIPDEVCKSLGVTDPSQMGIYSVCKIQDDVEEMTVNLQSPILINASTRVGRQVVLYDSKYRIDEKIK